MVQARWSFVNKDENLLTRLQNINLAFHFEVEQQVNGIFLNFFGFNGTAGVWRIKALEESGGWLERTTVEDMDIAVRAHLHGWKFIFLNDVEVFNYLLFWLLTVVCVIIVCKLKQLLSGTLSANANCQNLMKLIGSNSIDGILVLCKSPCFKVFNIHPVLHHSPNDNVHPRGYTSIVGCLLCPCDHVHS